MTQAVALLHVRCNGEVAFGKELEFIRQYVDIEQGERACSTSFGAEALGALDVCATDVILL